jgi:hypothetical protein
LAPIEYLQQFANKDITDENNIVDYNNYLYRDEVKDIMKDKYGVQTTGLSKPFMVGCLTQFVGENPKVIISSNLIDQFSSIEKTSSGNIKSTGYSDLFMAACFCALVRNKKAMEILPLIETKSVNIQGQQFLDQYTQILNIGSIHQKSFGEKISKDTTVNYSDEEILYTSDYLEDFYSGNDNFDEQDEGDFIPFFTE